MARTTTGWVLDGIEIPATHSDSRGPFYGNDCYLDGLISLISRNLAWKPVTVQVQRETVMVECLGWSGFTNGNLAYLSRYFCLPPGWGITAWSVYPTPIEGESGDGPRAQSLQIWLDRTLALAGAKNGRPGSETEHWLQQNRRRIESERRGEY